MTKFYLLFSLLLIFQAAAQKDSLEKYNYQQLSHKLSAATQLQNKPNLWKIYLDAVMRRNPSDSLKADIYYNTAWDYYRFQEHGLETPISMLNLAVKYAKKAKLKPVLLYSLESLSIFYSLKNDNDNSLKTLQEMKDIGETISEKNPLYVTFQASTARVYSTIGEFERSISIVKKSNKDIDNFILSHPKLSKDSIDELVWIKEGNYINLAQSYNFQKKLDSAGQCLQKAKELEKRRINKKSQNNIWVQEAFYLILSKKYDQAIAVINEADKKGNIESKNKRCRALYYLAVCMHYKKDYVQSLSLCKQALAINVKIACFMNFELELYKLATENAQALGYTKEENYYSEKFNATSQALDYAGKSRFIAKLYDQDLVLVKQELKSEKKGKIYFYYILGLFIIIGGCLYWYYYFQSKKDRKKFEKIIADFEEEKINSIITIPDIIVETNPEDQLPVIIDRHVINMSNGVDEKIVKQLISFERKKLFLSPSVSLSSMASNFNTNVAYLSSAIKKYKDNNFSGYINDLRIDYIIVKLKTCPAYLNYKIAYLAEECGFASHAVFIRIFTKKTGITPSKFISFLKLDQAETSENFSEN